MISGVNHVAATRLNEMPEVEGYEIIEQIGVGGMGTVWRAIHMKTQRQIALKILGAGPATAMQSRLRFEREIELTARLEHTNIARIYDSGMSNGLYYYSMAYIEGKHLDSYVKDSTLSSKEMVALLLKVCKAIQFAHQRGVIHRDLKPSNVIVDAAGEPCVLDFGLAKTLLEEDKGLTVSVAGDVAGTPAFMSPEQARGDIKNIDTRSDVYSLGVILYNIFTQQWPYDISGTQIQVMHNIVAEDPIRPTKFKKDIDSDAEAILLKSLAKSPEERYQSMHDLANDLQCFLDGLPIAAKTIDSWYVFKKLVQKHKVTSIIVASLFVIFSSTAFISLYSLQLVSKSKNEVVQEAAAFRTAIFEEQRIASHLNLQMFIDQVHFKNKKMYNMLMKSFGDQTMEQKCALFLISPLPLHEKIKIYLSDLPKDYKSLKPYMIAEHYMLLNDLVNAQSYFQQSVDTVSPPLEGNMWFILPAMDMAKELKR